uniref:Putative secreted protein n=1 Tax=Anopheles marajoara TaxID=58244 RepID=A0A2M4CDQ3_9DIPT
MVAFFCCSVWCVPVSCGISFVPTVNRQPNATVQRRHRRKRRRCTRAERWCRGKRIVKWIRTVQPPIDAMPDF